MSDAVDEPAEAFDLLANETRLEIIRALGNALGDASSPVTFSDLQARVDIQDNGKFNYHLQKLEGRFVERVDGGYELLPAGINVYQAVISGMYTGDAVVDPAPVEGESCPACGAGVTVWYENNRFHLGCQECDELGVRYPIPPGSFDDDDPASLVAAGSTWLLRDQLSMRRGLCPYCAGSVEGHLTDDREPMGEVGQAKFTMMAEYTCTRCHWSIYADLPVAMKTHPAVVSFFHYHGINIFDQHPWEDLCEIEEHIESSDPWRASVVYRLDGDELTLHVDERLTVLTVSEPARNA